jgi:DNA-binding transcriptional regulator YhcF (GntR family)
MLVDSSLDRPVYKQVADLIRTQILKGDFRPGQRLPAQKDYMQEHYVSRDTVERAMTVLRHEGLIVTDRGGSRVRPAPTRTAVPLGRGKVTARQPTEPERREHGITDGVPLLVVTRDGQEEIYPADRVEILVGADQPSSCAAPHTEGGWSATGEHGGRGCVVLRERTGERDVER